MTRHRQKWVNGTIASRHDHELVKRVLELREQLQIGTRYAVVTRIEEAA